MTKLSEHCFIYLIIIHDNNISLQILTIIDKFKITS